MENKGYFLCCVKEEFANKTTEFEVKLNLLTRAMGFVEILWKLK